ncbi:MAG: nucleotidyltransferase domain-containing protein [Bacteroidota bacterium]
MTVTDELKHLTALLADWAADAPATTLYLFGSRVRGDHRPDSDVDVTIAWRTADARDTDYDWWSRNNEELFVSIDARLPGKLRLLEEMDPSADKVRTGPQVYRDRNVICVLLPPKPQGHPNANAT